MEHSAPLGASVEEEVVSVSRRGFLGSTGAAAVGLIGASAMVGSGEAKAGFIPRPRNTPRGARALEQRIARANANLAGMMADPVGNGDEQSVPNFAAQYTKGLPHDAIGEVDPAAYRALQRACASNLEADWAAVPMGGSAKQVSPQDAWAFQMEGADPTRLRIPAAPTFSSEQRAAEMCEVYWMAVLRDVPFEQYAQSSLAAAAVADLRRFALFRDLTTQTLFRGVTAGEKIGPYLSQFFWHPIPYGMTTITQKYATAVNGVDFMTTLAECLRIQNGVAPSQSLTLGAPVYGRCGRDLGEYVHKDFSYQAFLNAALILLGLGGAALDDANPYKAYVNRANFVCMGGPDVLSMIAQVAVLALKAAWYQKWSVNRTLRPEVFALRVHQHESGVRSYPIHTSLFSSPVLDHVHSAHGTLLLPMAFAEGSPTHPAYPAGHATIAGACVTVLKAFFKETFVLPNPVVASDDGTALNAYGGAALTIGGELDKLAANISIGRNIAGVHYWSDGIEGMRLGEKVGLAFLADIRTTYPESFAGFSLRSFDGTSVTI
ncbi:MAG TPA: vanadium-dependent haloperoxidase [Patescibacteria group bacterium]|nr:vanadium-dependent haloperoxidase [Patescibacteria group bacterium]